MVMVLNEEMPQLLSVKSEVLICASCHAWYSRFPIFLDGDSKGDQCDKCGCTSFIVREGRSYGPKSKQWKWIEKEFAKCWRYFTPGDAKEVVVNPPFEFPPEYDDDGHDDPHYEVGYHINVR